MKIYSTKEVANKLKIHKRTVLNEIKRGNLKAKMIGNKFRITETALNSYINDDTGDSNDPEPEGEYEEGVYINTKQAAEILEVTAKTIQNYCNADKLECKRGKGYRWLVNKQSVFNLKEADIYE